MKQEKGYTIFKVVNSIIMLVIVFVTLFPFLNILAISFSSKLAVLSGKVSFYPVDFTLWTYKYLIGQSDFWLTYKNTVIYTVLGTSIGIFMTIICAYPLSKPDLKLRNIIMGYIVFTMFFSGGLIPTYLLVSKLGLIDTIWAMILPGCINAYNVIIMRTFFQSIPSDLEDAAEIDGLNQLGVLFRIILPLSKPVISTIVLFISVAIWNDWFTALIYFNDQNFYPVTLFLRSIVMGATLLANSGQQVDSSSTQAVPETLQAATIILVTVPILCVYPFIQKYFVQGIMIGSIKG